MPGRRSPSAEAALRAFYETTARGEAFDLVANDHQLRVLMSGDTDAWAITRADPAVHLVEKPFTLHDISLVLR